jgi:hypothetical protein
LEEITETSGLDRSRLYFVGNVTVFPPPSSHMFHRYEIEVTMDSYPDGGMMAILLLQSGTRNLEASVKQRPSCPSGMTRASTGLRRHVGSGLVEPGALSRSSRGRALVRNRIGEDLTFNSRFARRRPPQCGWKGLGRGPVVARMSQSSFRKGGSNRRAEHRPPRPHVPQDRTIHRNLADIRVPPGFTGASSYP